MQDELSIIKADMAIKEEKIIVLEAKLQINQVQQQTVKTEENHEANTSQQDVKIPAQVNNQLVNEVISTILEQDKVHENRRLSELVDYQTTGPKLKLRKKNTRQKQTYGRRSLCRLFLL